MARDPFALPGINPVAYQAATVAQRKVLVRRQVEEHRRIRRSWEAQAQAKARGEGFRNVASAHRGYEIQLRRYARTVSEIIESFATGEPPIVPPERMPQLNEALRLYSAASTPWSRWTATQMIRAVNVRSLAAWRSYTEGMGRALREEIATAPTGEAMRELLDYETRLITSLPTDAAAYVHEWTLKAIEQGQRAGTLVEQIAGQLAVTPSPKFREAWENAYDPEQFLLNRATLIARTETARTASVLTQVRAEHIESDGYIWRTAHDWKVRPSHRAMEGLFVPWSRPPILDNLRGHAGQLPNCRCIAQPVLPDEEISHAMASWRMPKASQAYPA